MTQHKLIWANSGLKTVLFYAAPHLFIGLIAFFLSAAALGLECFGGVGACCPASAGASNVVAPTTVSAGLISASTETEGRPWIFEGDRVAVSSERRFELRGHSSVDDGNTRIEAQRILFERDLGGVERFSVAGDVRLRAPEFRARVERLEIERARSGAEQVYFERVKGFTRCPEPVAGREVWQLDARRIVVNQELGLGSASGAWLRVLGMPILYLPYIYFPVDDRRRSGLLWPELRHSERSGSEIALPIYLNFAPHYDATLNLRQMSRRGAQLGLEWRHLLAGGVARANAAWMRRDRLMPDLGARWEFSWNHDAYWQDWHGVIDYAKVSDERYLEDFSATLAGQSDSHLEQSALLEREGEQTRLRIRVNRFQDLRHAEQGQASPRFAPQIEFERRARERPFSFDYLAELGYARFERARSADSRREIQGTRLFTRLGGVFPLHWRAAYLRLEAAWSAVEWRLDQPAAPAHAEQLTFDAPSVVVDAGMRFERLLSSGRQTLEPRLYYVYTARRQQENLPFLDSAALQFARARLFSPKRISGWDRLADDDRLALGLESRLFADDGRLLLSARIARGLYLRAPGVLVDAAPTSRSRHTPWIVEADWQPARVWQAYAQLGYDSRAERVDFARALLRFSGSKRLSAEAGFSLSRADGYEVFLTEDIQSLEAAAWWQAAPRWRFAARARRDFESSRQLETVAGFEYRACCVGLSLSYRRSFVAFDQVDASIFFRVQLNGLGGVGTSLDELIFSPSAVEQGLLRPN